MTLKPVTHDVYFPARLLAFSNLLKILILIYMNFIFENDIKKHL